jgi:signal transduction histidine kinase
MIYSDCPTILIVDDMPENISVLFDFLSTNAFEVLVARSGKSALQVVESAQPHLVLLDIMMPGMDGFEVCRQLKNDIRYADIPIIFMTALSETVDKVRGFSLGAVDYITKPFQQEEVLARINTHLTLYQLQQKLKFQNQELAIKNADLDAFASTVAHDLKTPLNAITGLSDILLNIHKAGLSHKQLECIELIMQSSYKMDDIINGLLLLATVSKQEITLHPLDTHAVLIQVKRRLATLLEETQAELIMPTEWPVAMGYMQWVEEVWVNYLSNGLKYGGQPPRLALGAEQQANEIVFWVQDNGPGLSETAQAQLFKPFSRLKKDEKKQGHGLGLSIVQRIVPKLGGRVGVQSSPGQGAQFYFTLPKA